MSIGKRIRTVRIESGITQKELAVQIGIAQQSLGKIESGLTKTPSKVDLLADVLGVNPHYLRTGKGPRLTVIIPTVPILEFNEIRPFITKENDFSPRSLITKDKIL